MLRLQETYAPRPIRYLKMWEHAGWYMKIYSIAYRGYTARPELVESIG